MAAGGGAVFAFLYARARDARKDLTEEVQAREVLKTSVDNATALVKATQEGLAGVRSEAGGLRSEVTALTSRAAILESKMDVFWKNVAFDVSKILHSPHPGWEHLDTLLDKFQENSITTHEMTNLTEHLREMVDDRWEGSPVSRADKVAASLLLRAIEQTREG